MKKKWTLEKLQDEANKYETRSEFREKDSKAYNSAKKLGYMNKIFENHDNNGYNKNKQKDGYWTKEKIKEVASKYDTILELRKDNNYVYKLCIDFNIINELFKDKENNGYSKYRVKDGYWTKEKIQEEADKCDSIEQFKNNCKKGYYMAYEYNLMSELFKNHINNGFKTDFTIIWTKEKLQEESNKYKTRKEFRENSISAYSAAKKKKLLTELFANHSNDGFSDKQVKNGYWTKERLQEEVDKYKTRKEFREKNEGAYSAAFKKKILNNLFENHPNKGYIYKDEWKDNSYVIYAYELIDFNKVYIGLTNNIERRDKQHLFSKNESLINFCKEKNIPLPKYKILEEKLNCKKAQNQEGYWINYYKNNNWSLLNIAKHGSLGGASKKWTIKKLQEEANKCKYRIDFYNNCRKACSVAEKKKIINELFKNHPNQGYKKRKKSE